MSSHDVVIVGAAPSGSIAALALARAGYRVALLDRAVFPRPKVCGNCINPAAWKIWSELGLTESFAALPHQEVAGFATHLEGRTLYRHAFRTPRSGPRAVGRDVFDAWLCSEARAAGVEFFPETTVTAVEAKTGTVQSSRGEFTGKLILGADGRNSLVARHSGLMPPPRRCHRVAWQTSLVPPADFDHDAHMHIFEEGYFGMVRYSPDRAVLSMVLDARRTQDPQALARRYLPGFPAQEWLRMNPITRAPARIGSDRVWLLGDAARVVEPFTGEGITFALKTGLLAAGFAAKGIAHHDFSAALCGYAGAHQRLYARRAWVNTLVRWTLTTPSHAVRLLRKVDFPPGVIPFLARQVHATS